MEPHKVNLINVLQLIGSVSKQDEYYQSVPSVNVVTELINQWFDDFFKPDEKWFQELFTKDEWDVLIDFHNFYSDRVDKLPQSYLELKGNYFWKEIVGKANWALDRLGWQHIVAVYD